MLSIKIDPNVPIVKMDKINGFFDFGLEAGGRTWTIAEYMERPTIFITNDPIQRNNTAWSDEQGSELFASIIERVSIGSIKTQVIQNLKAKRRNYIVLDGAQRLTWIKNIIRNLKPLAKLRYAVEGDDGEAKKDAEGNTIYVEGLFVEGVDNEDNKVYLDISGLYFKDLPVTIQNRIYSYNFEVEEYYFDNPEIKKVLFSRWNNGESLTPIEKLKSKLSDPLLLATVTLKEKEIFKAGLSPKKVDREENLMAILQSMAVINTDNNTGLSMKTISAIHYDFSIEVIEKVSFASTYLNDIYTSIEETKLRNKIFNKTKTIALMYVVSKARDEEILPDNQETFLEWATQYYTREIAIPNATSGTTSGDRVKARNSAPLVHMRQYLLSLK
ncbi:DUF262 domain-containing protein [Paenibacillus polymyxa]|uniref:DUF262 domain-containing protein n=1 Tax=Paenibacillus polymyxa TaxID=1406 RepID=UPI0025B664B9|nr:DUF262 domain-containing protein [Paenibacillus polymyxa]MDN4106162.1 DUF262 domain-containing protein [Paenibacillus polymyxa]